MHTLTRSIVLLALVAAGTGCGSDTTGPAQTDPQQLFWRVALNHHAVTLSTVAPFDTVRLVATPWTADGVSLSAGATTRFTVINGDTSVIVDDDGMVRANSSTQGATVRVRASTTVGGITRSDSVMLVVTTVATPPRLETLSIRPDGRAGMAGACGDVSILGLGQPALTPVLVAAPHDTLHDVPVAFSSSDSVSVAVDPVTGTITPNCPLGRIGQVATLYATTTFYGVTRTDSVRFTPSAPQAAQVIVAPNAPDTGADFNPRETVLGEGGVVVWWSPLYTIDIVFDNPPAVRPTETSFLWFGFMSLPPSESGGNVALMTPDSTNAFAPDNFRLRRFPVAGTYSYHSTRYPIGGRIVVLAATP